MRIRASRSSTLPSLFRSSIIPAPEFSMQMSAGFSIGSFPLPDGAFR